MKKVNNCILLLLIGLSLETIAFGQVSQLAIPNFSGTWRMDIERAGGVIISSYFKLHQIDTNVNGTVVINGAVELPLRKPHLDQADLVFRTAWNMDYRLHHQDEKLLVTIKHSSKGIEKAYAFRVSDSEALPPQKITLPELLAVPSNQLALTPPMGWNSWNHFAEKVNDSIVRAAADALVSTRLAAAGYSYINIDDCWQGYRDSEGNIVPNKKFPNMKALADYVHSKGLKLGIYSSPGPFTCGGYLGSLGHEEQDAKTYASWGIDYLKYDWCSASRLYSNDELQATYQKMGLALAKSGRPIVYSLCEYGMGDVWKWGPKVAANLWRTTGDIQDNWLSMSNIGFSQDRLAAYAGPGHWNDPDMLEVGNGGMTATEYSTHFSLWCLLAAPLMAGNDLQKMSPSTLEILSNSEVIAIDQDLLGKQAITIFKEGDVQILARDLKDGAKAVGLFNTGLKGQIASVSFLDLKVNGKQKIRDLWLHKDLGQFKSKFSVHVPPHGVVLIKVSPKAK
ncbi:MAG: glycoside hydrolase family 27 protein [Bacteroidota bacterium]